MHLRDLVKERVLAALTRAQTEQLLPSIPLPEDLVERPQNTLRGDFASSAPLKLARTMHMNPMEIAQTIVKFINTENIISNIEIASPGFINITVSSEWLQEQVDIILNSGDLFGSADVGKGQSIQVEYVSVNPTGPLHVGHARGAVLGSVLSSVLEAAGYQVSREYYLNDAGNQIDLFHQSLFATYSQALGKDVQIPDNGYKGHYMIELGRQMAEQHGSKFLELQTDEGVSALGSIGVDRMVQEIKNDLDNLQVSFDVWFSEKSLYSENYYETTMKKLEEAGHVSKREGATWFVSSALGEDKDNVLVKSTGVPTYFASDAAYHYNKFAVRKFDRVIDIWGADHAGHVSRVKAVLGALGLDPDRLDIIIGQMVSLKRNGETVRVSKRTGDMITLKELVEEVGSDACRFFFLARSADAQMDFDLELAVKQSQDNPVFYLQYAYARMAGIIRNAEENQHDLTTGDVHLLATDEELTLIRHLMMLPEVIDSIAQTMEPHHLPHYTMELAVAFHSFYDRCRVISENEELTSARLKLTKASKINLGRCLSLMGINAPDRM